MAGTPLKDGINPIASTVSGEPPTAGGVYSLKTDLDAVLDRVDGEFVSTTAQDLHLYANASTGNDANDGLTPGTAKQTLSGVDAALPYVIGHNVNIHLEGAFTELAGFTFCKTLRNGARLLIDGGDALTVIADNAGSPWVSDINSVSSVGLSTLGWTIDQYTGYMVEIVTGPAAGEIRTIRANSATTITPTVDFSVDPGVGAEFHIVEPATSYTVNTTPFDFLAQSNGGRWSVGGHGMFVLQRISFKGICPVQILGGDKGEGKVFLAACVVDKSQVAGNMIRVILATVHGVSAGFIAEVYDPSILGGTTLLTENKGGVGIVGGDGSVVAFDVLVEGCASILRFEGSFVQRMIGVVSSNLWINSGTRMKSFTVLGAQQSYAYPITDAYFGGFIPFGVGFSAEAGIGVLNSVVFLGDNVDISGGLSGLYVRSGNCYVSGALSGAGNLTFGAVVRYNAGLFFETGALAVTLTGVGGDLSWDTLAPVAGGFAGILAGTPVSDPLLFSTSAVQAYSAQ